MLYSQRCMNIRFYNSSKYQRTSHYLMKFKIRFVNYIVDLRFLLVIVENIHQGDNDCHKTPRGVTKI